jgi:hypothetical protein
VRRSSGVSRAVAGAALGLASVAFAHDLITAEAAERYLAQAQRDLAVIRSRDPAPRRSEAHLMLARMEDEIRDLLNRDLAMHGKVQGLPSNVVIERLKATGAPLPWSDRLGRYAAPVDHYRAALELDGKGRRANEALFGLIYGSFYDSFRDDPLQSMADEPALSRSLIELGERFVREYPGDANVEEVKFIVAISHVRLARAGVDKKRQSLRARELLNQFQRDYPDSLRAAAVPVLLEALP